MLNYFEISEAKKYIEKLLKNMESNVESNKNYIEPVVNELLPTAEDKEKINLSNIKYKEDRLTEIIKKTCLRANFKTGLLVDSTGLPLAYFNLDSPELYGAISSLIIEMKEKISRLNTEYTLDFITFEINSFEKLVVKEIKINTKKYLLIYIMEQSNVEKEEILISSKMLENEIGK